MSWNMVGRQLMQSEPQLRRAFSVAQELDVHTETLTREYRKDPLEKDYPRVQERRVHFVPLVNPDGLESSRRNRHSAARSEHAGRSPAYAATAHWGSWRAASGRLEEVSPSAQFPWYA